MDIPTSSPYDMIPMSDALNLITTTLTPLPPETVPTHAALHRTLATPIHSPYPHPAFRASIKDGYALNTTASPSAQPLPIRAGTEALAGQPSANATPLQHGEAEYVTTGAPVPDGATTVVMVEHTERKHDLLFIPSTKWPKPGADIREIGCDLAKGEKILSAGDRLTAADIGLLAACAVTHVQVVTRPRIGILSTGDEVLSLKEVAALRSGQRKADGEEADDALLPFGRIVDSNRPMLLAAVAQHLPQCDAVDLGVVRDEYNDVKQALQNAIANCHVVVTSGGVSMGKRDVVKPVLDEIASIQFGRVLMKPGKPLTFATKRHNQHTRAFVAVPGNPVSSFVCFHLGVAVAARRLAGWGCEEARGRMVEVILEHDFRLDAERPEYHRATVRWVEGVGYVGASTGKQASSRLLSARGANALLALPAEEGVRKKGEKVRAYLLNAGWGG